MRAVLLFSLLLGSSIAYQTTFQNAYTYLDQGCQKQPLKVHTTVVDPQCSRDQDSPYQITYCNLKTQEYITEVCGEDSQCDSDCGISSLYNGNNCSYYDDYFHPNTEYNCTLEIPEDLFSAPNTFVSVSYNNSKCAGQEDIYDILVHYMGKQNCYDSYTAYNDYDSTYYIGNGKTVTQYTCRGPGCKQGCNVTATYDIGCHGINGSNSVQYIYNMPVSEEPCLDGCPAKEEDPCLDGCPEEKEEEPCLDGCPAKEEEPCLDGCPAKEEEPCLDGCPAKEEEPCLDGCPGKEEEPCLDGCPEEQKEEPCLDGCPDEKEEEPCLDGCPAKEEPCLDGCPEEQKEEPCLDGCPAKEEEPCLDGCPAKEEEPCLDGCPEEQKEEPCLDGCPAKIE